MAVLPPGTLLQLMYLRKRLRQRAAGRFIEIGPGAGEITQLLLDMGWSGRSYDLDQRTIKGLESRFDREISEHRFSAINEDFLSLPTKTEKADLIISCMVMEHLEDMAQSSFMKCSRDCLTPEGLMIGLVPASPAHWGIEDEIAGHYRRYTRKSIKDLIEMCDWQLLHIAGLTFPVSNLLLPVSDYFVKNAEREKLRLSLKDRTKESGRRKVRFKTYFPDLFSLLLNEFVLYPLYILQNMYLRSEKALVLYFEAKPCAGTTINDK